MAAASPPHSILPDVRRQVPRIVGAALQFVICCDMPSGLQACWCFPQQDLLPAFLRRADKRRNPAQQCIPCEGGSLPSQGQAGLHQYKT